MYPRLKLAQKLLRDDGVIFVSIDDNEQANLKLLMDEIFGETNFIVNFIWAAGRKNDSRYASNSHEYIISYVRNFDFLQANNTLWRQKKKGLEEIKEEYERLKTIHKENYAAMTRDLKKWFSELPDSHPSKDHRHYSTVDARGVYFPADISWPGGGGPKYEVCHPKTGKPVKVPSSGWRLSKPETMQEWIKEDRIHFGKDESSVPCRKSYLIEHNQQTPYSVIYQDGRAASKRLRSLMGGDCFDFPKDEEVLHDIIEMVADKDCIILDFFAGSGTTAHAVMQLNAEDNGSRKYILVQLDEATKANSEARKANYNTIDEISRERIKRAAVKIKQENATTLPADFDFGFKHYRLITPSEQTLDKVDAFNPDTELIADTDMINAFAHPDTNTTGVDTLLATWLVDDGLTFDTKMEKLPLAGYTAHYVPSSGLLYLLEPDWNTAALKALLNKIGKDRLPVSTIVLYPHAFDFEARRELKTNLKAVLEQSPVLIERY